MPLCTAYNIQHRSHHAYDIYTSTCMLACKKKLKCQHFSANCPDVLNVGSVPSAGCNLDIIPTDMKQTFGRAYELLFQVHASLRLPLNKCDLTEYQNTIDTLLVMLKRICRESSPTDCNSIKFHYPIHWGNTRSELGCAADEKSLKKNCQSLKSGTIVLLMKNVASIPKCRCRVSLLLPSCVLRVCCCPCLHPTH
jgi:hypothetical protein